VDTAHTQALDELADRLHSLAIHLLRRVRVVDAASGLSAARLSTLSVLVFGGPRTVGELAAAEQVSAATMSRLLSGLEAAGLVRREADPADARRVRVRVTATGERSLQAARGRRIERMAALLQELGPMERATVSRAVALLEAAVGGADEP
jgi:DNA-binding MarR family transcriptional regulator